MFDIFDFKIQAEFSYYISRCYQYIKVTNNTDEDKILKLLENERHIRSTDPVDIEQISIIANIYRNRIIKLINQLEIECKI